MVCQHLRAKIKVMAAMEVGGGLVAGVVGGVVSQRQNRRGKTGNED